MANGSTFLLKNAHVIDPQQNIDGVMNVVISGGKIEAVGKDVSAAGAKVLDLSGSYLTPGWIDIHVHAYGALGFSDPDSIGVAQGVTSVVDAGGTGILTLDEFMAMVRDHTTTSVYAGAHVHPLGIIGFEESGRGLNNVAVEKWVEWAEANPGVLRYLKVSAYSLPNAGPLYVGKGLSKILGIPLYQHIGEMQEPPPYPTLVEDAFKISDAGDIITHVYHNNPGKVIGDDGKVLPFVREAQRRGVLFDIGFGSMNFSWPVAEKCFQQDLLPYFISSDLQQFNIVYPCHSLANVMSIFLKLGMSIQNVIECVTSHPARALKLMDRAGSLAVGMPADVTVFQVEDGEFELFDCYKMARKAKQRIVPTLAFKNGKQIEVDLTRGEQESNWFMQVSEDEIPAVAERLSTSQREFLKSLHAALSSVEWVGYNGSKLNAKFAYELQDIFNRVLRAHSISLRDGLRAVYDCFLEQTFTVQIGLFLTRLDRSFVLARMKAVANQKTLAMA
ncbi:amidohydrolase family protein [Bradyrhizobium sp. dw_78]|uniref:amidohydrolase family protein n=1 Tax=Bradyrhizobium sp. dw_78 TaxID=2719793 RepID=UPI001BD342F4|nr:amidohydrolase family protein [Bradyrhizobium sp. dw_78]